MVCNAFPELCYVMKGKKNYDMCLIRQRRMQSIEGMIIEQVGLMTFIKSSKYYKNLDL